MRYYDQHVHSCYSFDSEQSIVEYLNKASELGIEHFVLTDHLDLNYLESNNDLSFDIKKEQDELSSLRKRFPKIKILNGIEVGYSKFSLNRAIKLIKENQFDLINLSVHEDGEFDFYYKDGFIKNGINETLKMYFAKIIESICSFPDYDVVSHVDFGFKTAYLIDKSLKLEMFENEISEVLKQIIKNDKTLEINTKVQEFINDEHTLYLLKLYKKLGGKNLTLSSDAHQISRYCLNFEHYISLIKQVGFDHLNYFIARKRYNCKI